MDHVEDEQARPQIPAAVEEMARMRRDQQRHADAKAAEEARVKLDDYAKQITEKDGAMRSTRKQMADTARDIGVLLNLAFVACKTCGQQWGKWLEASPFKYSTQHANNLRAVAEHWDMISKEMEKNPHMGTTEAVQVLKAAGVRKENSKGGGPKNGKKRPRMQVTYKALTVYVEKYPNLKRHISEVMALLKEMRLHAGKKTFRVEVKGKPAEQGM